jgi:uncharacterized RDD family membrane protein YckC
MKAMAVMWYYAKGAQQGGPVSGDRIGSLLATGKLSPSDMAWREGMPGWAAIDAIPELNTKEGAEPTPSSLGHPLVAESVGYAPRAKAFLLDVVIMCLPAVILSEILVLPLALLIGDDSPLVRRVDAAVGFAFWPAYFGAFESSRWQASVGKRILGLKVTDDEGCRATGQAATWRYLCLALTGGLGALPLFWSPDHLGLQDKWSRTRVVRN